MLNRDSIIESSKYDCRVPRGDTHTETVQLCDDCSVVIVNDFLDDDSLSEYIDQSCTANRIRDSTVFGAQKPRYEVSYTVDGNVNQYSGRKHHTTKYPDHVLKLTEKIQSVVEEHYGPIQLSTGIDIHYPRILSGGGSISKHSDDEMDWCAVAIYSLGQTRYLRVRRKDGSGSYHNIKLVHNSLVIMLDSKECIPGQFQRLYTHQVDKLTSTVRNPQDIGDRLSLNVRFLRLGDST